MREIETYIGFVIGVVEVIDPCCSVGIDIDNVGIDKIKIAGKSAGYGLSDDFAFIVDVGGIFEISGVAVGTGLSVLYSRRAGLRRCLRFAASVWL